MENQLEFFIKIWDSFANVMRGALLAEAAKGPLTFARAKMILAKESLSWQNDFATTGRWLSEFQKLDERKGKEIRRILTQDMKFFEEKMPTDNKSAKFIGAMGGGFIGYGVASATEMGMTGTAITTLLPMAVCFVGGNIYAATRNQRSLTNVIDAYCMQLDTYKLSVIAILNA